MSTSTTQSRSGERSYHHGNLRAKLLDAAVEVIARDGVEALSLRSLARSLGVSHAAPARHFATKTELLAAVASDSAGELASVTSRAIEQAGGDPKRRLYAMAKAYVQWAIEHPAQYGILRNPEIMRHADDALKEKISTQAMQQKGTLREAQALGWKASENTDYLLFQLLATLAGAASLMSAPFYRTIIPNLNDTDFLDFTIKSIFE